MKNFWKQLPRPFLVQAPMEDVTDTVFRQILSLVGKPDVFFTEFTNTDGLFSKGKSHVIHRLQFTQTEKPLIAQIWGTNPEMYAKTARLIQEMGFDGIDINMGCPVKTVTKKGACAGLINTPSLAKEIFLATKENAGNLPISIKTRLGYSTIQTETWIGGLLTLNPDALTIHARTALEMSKVPAHWDEIQKIVALKKAMHNDTTIIGNGDILSYQQAQEAHRLYGVDGIMIGRGIFHDLFIFNKDRSWANESPIHKIDLLIKHITLFDTTWGKRKHFDIMKKFYKIYLHDIAQTHTLRDALMNVHTAQESLAILHSIKRETFR